MAGVDVITDFVGHPSCPHGPTILFSRVHKGKRRNFFSCSSCRDRKDCSFFVWQDEFNKTKFGKEEIWNIERQNFLKDINHKKLFVLYKKVECMPDANRLYCHTCSKLDSDTYAAKHDNHNILKPITSHQLTHPSEVLIPLDNPKKEAQFLFSKSSVTILANILKDLKYSNVLCIGTPRLHEYLLTECEDVNSLLLDFDHRYHSFYSPLQFCWYNSFNHHFFFKESENVFNEFLKCNGKEDIILVMDPPFGGRVEPLAYTVKTINSLYKKLNKVSNDLPVFWIFPYFMEPQILNSLPDYQMLDYKVDYENHPLFKDGPKGRKQGSPVRIFTNIKPSLITLPKGDYKYCKLCCKWVSHENRHCPICNLCTSKDGRTYKHCNICQRCVKPTWEHCTECKRCAQIDHKCGELVFSKDCFHCKQPGHKKRECPQVNHNELHRKRKLKHTLQSTKRNKK